jgi:hypothetical protein
MVGKKSAAKPGGAWKKGRGKLGPLAPILGSWTASTDSPMGPMSCIRTYTLFGEGWVRLEAEWKFGAGKANPKLSDAQKAAMQAYAGRGYKEVAIFGPNADGVLSYWSFTSDGKKSEGALADGTDVHPQALCFEAQMPAGLARQVFWPDEAGGWQWAVEARNKKGWSRFSLHHYRPA